MNLLDNLTIEDIIGSLERSLELQKLGKSIWQETPRAGRPRSQYIDYRNSLHPLKAITLDAMFKSGIDQNDPQILGYTSHMGRDWLRKIENEAPFSIVELTSHEPFEVTDFEKSQKTYEVLSRPNQANFRNALLSFYKHMCPITKCRVIGALEAAHIQPKSANGSDMKENGILLRADIHRLFDSNQCALCPQTGIFHFSLDTKEYYHAYDQQHLVLPDSISLSAFSPRWKEFQNH